MNAPSSAGPRNGRLLRLVLLGVALALVLLTAGALLWLHSGSGRETLGRFVANEARTALAGDLQVRDLRVSGFLRVCAERVELRDPDGNRALAADRACATLRPWGLVRKRVSLASIELENPWIELATVPGPTPGSHTTTLARALAARTPKAPKQPSGGPLEWTIDVGALSIHGGALAIRPGLGEPATLQLADLDVANARVHVAQTESDARLALRGELLAPGRLPAALSADARIAGALDTGAVELSAFALRLGQSGFDAQGRYDLTRGEGELHLRNLAVLPADLDVLRPAPAHREGAPREELLLGEVRGEADARLSPRSLAVDLRLRAGGGTLAAKATAALRDASPAWSVELAAAGVDPGALTPRSPRGRVSLQLRAQGTGVPRFDAHGVDGDLTAQLHVGPARLDRIGPLVLDLDATLDGRRALVRAFTATGLGLHVQVHGRAVRDSVALDLRADAADLAEVGRAAGLLQRKRALPLAGALQLSAHVTGSPQSPDAEVHLRAPRLRWGPTLSATGLSVDGTLQGDLRQPDGVLALSAQRLEVGKLDLGAPRVHADLKWPVAHLQVDAGVKNGQLLLAGDARIDEDRDGLLLSRFALQWPEATLALDHDVRVHFRDEVIVEPLDLRGDVGSLRFQAQYRPESPAARGRVDASAVVQGFDLSRLPRFALPPGAIVRGRLDATAVLQGPLPRPDLDLRADLKGGGAQRLGMLAADGHAHVHLHHDRLRTDGWLEAHRAGRVRWNGELPAAAPTRDDGKEPVRFELAADDVDLAALAQEAQLVGALRLGLSGRVGVRVLASGTEAAPRATVAVELRQLATRKLRGVDARAGLLLERGRAALDGSVLLQGQSALGFTAQTAFDPLRALDEPGYVAGALHRPVTAEVAVTQLRLPRLAEAGLLPEGSTGALDLSLHLEGTPLRPLLRLAAAGREVGVGRLRGLGFQGQLVVNDLVRVGATAESNGDVVARLESTARVSGAELVQIALDRGDPTVLEPLLDRSVSLVLEMPGLPVARAEQLAGRARNLAEGRLEGRVVFDGSAARPHLLGRVAVKDLTAQARRLGAADVYVEATSTGAIAHLGIDPPGGGSLLGHARLDADLGARTLLRRGPLSVLDGDLTGDLRANHLDLGFLGGGFIPLLRRAAGKLDGNVAISGALSRPQAQGEAHLRGALLDVVGQGVFDDVGLDAKFSPREVVLDRLTGSSGDGTFAAVVVAARRPLPEGDGDKIEFTGEVHLGDAESVKGRSRGGRALSAGPIPIRQAGEQRADVGGVMNFFGDWNDGLLTVEGRIPDAKVKIRQLPDKRLPSLKPDPDVVLIHPGEKPHPPGREPEEVEAEALARKTANFRLHAHLVLDHLYVQAPDFEFPVESDLHFDYDAKDPDHPTADGSVHVPEGSFSALGRRFTIQDAKITETGGAIDDPELEVKAAFENPKASVQVNVSGSAKDPQLDMSSQPPMDQDAIAFFLATGRIQGTATQTGGGVDLSGAATSVLGSVLFGQVRKELADVLPVDVLTIETGEKGVSQASVGKYVGDRVFIGYRARLAPAPGENQNEGRIEYEITRSLDAEATVGEKNGDVSVLFTHNF